MLVGGPVGVHDRRGGGAAEGAGAGARGGGGARAGRRGRPVPRMHERPIGDLVDALRSIGARIDYRGKPGFPPLMIHPANISVVQPVPVKGDVSSQFLTALLMALPLT